MTLENKHIAIIGAGPAGIAAAGYLTDAGAHIALINRDIRPGGLAEYGIYFRKHLIKESFRKQFINILAKQNITYFGNIKIGQDQPISIQTLEDLGFDAILITTGAQNTKWLGLPHEDASGVYHAKDLTFFYNSLPNHPIQNLSIGSKVVLIGLGNVMVDIARYLTHEEKVEEIIITARRGPGEVKFTQKEWLYIANNLDKPKFDQEMEKCKPIMETAHQDYEASYQSFFKSMHKAHPKDSETKISFDFFARPNQIIVDQQGKAIGLEVADTILIEQENGYLKPKDTGNKRIIDADQIIFCIGDEVDQNLGLQTDKWNQFITHSSERSEDEKIQYQLVHPQNNLFVAGWARKPSKGLAGQAKKDGIQAAQTIESFLQTHTTSQAENAIQQLQTKLSSQTIINKQDWMQLLDIENQIADIRGLPFFRFSSNEDVLRILKKK